MTTITREQALQEFGSDEVGGAELKILMQSDRLNTGQQMAHIGEKWWRFIPAQDQLETLARNR
ncbi:MAG: hypothetical protein ABR907_16745 [Terracidiphilus sp.]